MNNPRAKVHIALIRTSAEVLSHHIILIVNAFLKVFERNGLSRRRRWQGEQRSD
jgi:hypothetical protein